MNEAPSASRLSFLYVVVSPLVLFLYMLSLPPGLFSEITNSVSSKAESGKGDYETNGKESKKSTG